MKFADLHEAADYVEHRAYRIEKQGKDLLEKARELLIQTDVARLKHKTYFPEYKR